jgi:hypothetical protein
MKRIIPVFAVDWGDALPENTATWKPAAVSFTAGNEAQLPPRQPPNRIRVKNTPHGNVAWLPPIVLLSRRCAG